MHAIVIQCNAMLDYDFQHPAVDIAVVLIDSFISFELHARHSGPFTCFTLTNIRELDSSLQFPGDAAVHPLVSLRNQAMNDLL